MIRGVALAFPLTLGLLNGSSSYDISIALVGVRVVVGVISPLSMGSASSGANGTPTRSLRLLEREDDVEDRRVRRPSEENAPVLLAADEGGLAPPNPLVLPADVGGNIGVEAFIVPTLLPEGGGMPIEFTGETGGTIDLPEECGGGIAFGGGMEDEVGGWKGL